VNYRVLFAPEAEEQLADLYRFIAAQASIEVADRYTDAIVDFCESLTVFPRRGTQRDDVRPGLRVTNYRKRVVIAFSVDANVISILGLFYGGQNFEALLRDAATP